MKRVLVLGVLAATFCIPALASGQADPGKYVGAIDGQDGSKLTIRIALRDGTPTVTEIKVKRLDLDCEGDPGGNEGTATLRGEIPVRSTGAFKVAADNGKTTFKTRAKVKGDRIKGTIRFFGLLDTDNGGVLDCDSGRQSFKTTIE